MSLSAWWGNSDGAPPFPDLPSAKESLIFLFFFIYNIFSTFIRFSFRIYHEKVGFALHMHTNTANNA